jgi:hypothetical protein
MVALAVMVIVLRAWLGREDLSQLPYQRQRYLLSPAERAFFEVLCRAAGDHFYVFPKVRVADVLYVPVGTTRWYARFNRIAQKHLDFVLCSQATLMPVLAIELDDQSHARPNRQARDGFVNAAFQAAKFPLERVLLQRAYEIDDIRKILHRYTSPTSVASVPPDGVAHHKKEWRSDLVGPWGAPGV